MKEKYVWAVEVTKPKDEKTHWARPARYMVIAEDMQSAIKITIKAHPDVTFIKIIRDRNVDGVLGNDAT